MLFVKIRKIEEYILFAKMYLKFVKMRKMKKNHFPFLKLKNYLGMNRQKPAKNSSDGKKTVASHVLLGAKWTTPPLV